jgi:hypothetical protein
VLNVEIRGCLHGENKLIISKILIFVGAFAPTIYNVALPVHTHTHIYVYIEVNIWHHVINEEVSTTAYILPYIKIKIEK